MRSIKLFVQTHIFSICIFFSGFVFGLLFPVFELQVENKITIADILELGITVILGLYLATTISNRQNANRIEKDLLIQRVNKIQDFIDSCPALCNTESISAVDAAKALKDLNVQIIQLENIIPISKNCRTVEIKLLKQQFKQLRESITKLRTSNGVIKPNHEERKEIINTNFKFRNELFRTIVDINNQIS